MTTQGLEGLLGALNSLAEAFAEASAEYPPLLHELLVARFPRKSLDWWEGFLADSYYPRTILGADGVLYRAVYPAGDWGQEWSEVFPDGQRCSRFHGNGDGLARFNQLAGHGYELMRAIASDPGNASTALSEAVRDPGFRPPGYGLGGPVKPIISEARFPYEERGRFGWIDLVYRTARLYSATCEVQAHMFGDLEQERRDHHHSPEVYTAEAFATEFNVEVLGSTEIDAFTLAERVIGLWLGPPRPIELPPPIPISLWRMASADRLRQGTATTLDPSVSRPTWDAEARELRWGGVVLKKFSKPAENQTTILSTFEDDGWPAVIDDPLTGGRGLERTKRLGDTVRALNKDMLVPGVIVFERDGTGKRVRWRRVG